MSLGQWLPIFRDLLGHPFRKEIFYQNLNIIPTILLGILVILPTLIF